MKNLFAILIISSLCCCALQSKAQDGLKFSKALLLEVTKDGLAFTVPEGKIWRIEAAGGNVMSIYLQSSSKELMYVLYGNIQYTPMQSHFNLPVGFSGFFILGYTGSGKDAKGFVSVTEYTISP